MLKNAALKTILILVVSVLTSVIFLFVYNHYLLDRSLANLRVSLKVVEKAKSLEEVKKIRSILQDAFVMEVTAGDFDLAAAEKKEISEKGLEMAARPTRFENEIYMSNLSSATKIDYAGNIAENISEQDQLEDLRYFIEDVITQKTKNQSVVISNLEKLIIGLSPQKREESKSGLNSRIESAKKQLLGYSGRQRQEKLLEIARLYLKLKDWDSCYDYLNKTLELGSQNYSGLKAQFYLAILYKLKDKPQDSLVIFERIRKALPKEWKMFAYYQEADSLDVMGQKEKAISVLEEAFDQDYSSEISQVAKLRAAHTYLYDLDDPESARRVFNELKAKISTAKEKGTEKERTSEAKISTYIDKKMTQNISKRYREEAYELLKVGYSKSKSINYLEALKKFNLALRDNEDDPLVISGKALTFYLIGQHQEAIEEARKAKEIAPDDVIVLVNLGFIYYNVGMLDEAIAEYRKALKIRPDSALINYNLGTLYVLSGELSKAGFYLERSLEINPDFAYPHNNLGYLSWIKGGYGEAKRWLEKAIAFKEDYVDGRYNLGIVLYILGKYDSAEEEFLKVRALEPSYKRTEWYLSEINKK